MKTHFMQIEFKENHKQNDLNGKKNHREKNAQNYFAQNQQQLNEWKEIDGNIIHGIRNIVRHRERNNKK